MTRDLHLRVEQLEAKFQRNLSLYLDCLILLAIGFYLGDPEPGEPVGSAIARALGYPSLWELQKAKKS
jgi:hypothetical protein